jgi:hypothetical protein
MVFYSVDRMQLNAWEGAEMSLYCTVVETLKGQNSWNLTIRHVTDASLRWTTSAGRLAAAVMNFFGLLASQWLL